MAPRVQIVLTIQYAETCEAPKGLLQFIIQRGKHGAVLHSKQWAEWLG